MRLTVILIKGVMSPSTCKKEKEKNRQIGEEQAQKHTHTGKMDELIDC
jgi:hypothetical protein